MEKIEIPIELKQAICNNELIVFVGAGLSYDFYNINGQQLEGWSNLVKYILLHLQSKDYDVAYLLSTLKKQEPIKVLDLIASDIDIPKKEISDYLKDFLDLEDTKNDYTLHQLLYELSPKIITTNYDTAFERSISTLSKNRAYKGKNYELTKHKDTHASLLFKLHGCFEDLDSMVLFPKDYTNLYQNIDKDAEHSLLVLRNIIMNKSVLFIGTGMGDFQINNIFNEVKTLQGKYNQKHFIITKTNLDSALDFLTPIDIKAHSETKGIIEYLITLKKECSNNDTEELLKLKEDLQKANDKIKKLETQVNPSKDELLEREALKYFSKGVNYSISNKHKKAIRNYQIAIELKSDFYEAYFNWGTNLGNLADTKNDKQKEKLYNLAFQKYQKAIEVNPNRYEAFLNWGTGLGNLAGFKKNSQKEEFYNLSFEKFKNAIERKPNYYGSYYNWAVNLAKLAEIKNNNQKEIFYTQAFEKYKISINLKSNNQDSYYNWGTDLVKFALTKNLKQREKLLLEAIEKFKKAIIINPNFHDVYYNYGTCLAYLTQNKNNEEKEKLLLEAIEKFKKTIEIYPNAYYAYSNWGTALLTLSKNKKNEKREEIFTQIFEKFKKAIEIKSDSFLDYFNWGNSLIMFSKNKNFEQKKILFSEAIEKLKKSINYGGNHYHLASLYAVLENRNNSLEHLKISLKRREETTAFILKDEVWKNYLNDEDFKAIIEKYNN